MLLPPMMVQGEIVSKKIESLSHPVDLARLGGFALDVLDRGWSC